MTRLLARLLLPAAVAAALLTPAASASGVGASGCPGQFLVYQPAPAGPLYLAANSYTIEVLNLSCASASDAFASFIGREVLPDPWTANVQSRTFFGSRGSFSISAPRPSSPGPSGDPRCPSFSILDKDRIGSVPVPRGQYALAPSGKQPLTCLAAARLLVRILEAPAGELPGSWTARRAHGSDPGAVLADAAGRRVLLRRLDSATAGGGHTSP